MKKLTPMHIFSFLIIAFAITSCSSEPQNVLVEKTYSNATQREFEEIENNDFKPAHIDSSLNKTSSHPTVIKDTPREKTKIIAKDLPPKTHLENESNIMSPLSLKNQERLQEINQNLAFFCMKHRKDSAFKTEEKCLLYTKKVLQNCEKKHKLINTVMVNCIKDRLKKGF